MIVATLLTSVACGKKGPPLTPFVLVPSAPTLAVPRRVGNDLYVDVTVPATNLDKSMPAAVSRIDIYGVTSLTPPARARFLEIATLVATIPVAPSGEPGDTIPVVPDPAVGALQGATVTVRDTLSADEFEPRTLPVLVERAAPPLPSIPGATASAPARFLRRFYLAIASTDRNRIGPPSPIVELPLSVIPQAPETLEISVSDVAASVSWTPSGGLIGWLADRPLPEELAPGAVDLRPPGATAAQEPPPMDWLPGPTTYRLYRSISPDPLALPAAGARGRPWEVTAPVALSPPLPALLYDDPLVFDDRERCYYVRAVRSMVESEPSPAQCIRAIDTSPPVMPTGLAAITAEGVINLIWEPNVEEDLGGYVVLRRDAADATLVQLTSRPIPDARYSDRTVTPGVRYTYEVRAVDRRVPVPNASEPAQISETAQ